MKEAPSVGSPQWMYISDMGTTLPRTPKPQTLGEMTKYSLLSVWMLILCVENVDHSFLPPDISSLKHSLLQRLILPRSAKAVSSLQLCAINSTSLFICMEKPCWMQQPCPTALFCIGSLLCLWCCLRKPSPHISAFCSYLFFLHSFTVSVRLDLGDRQRSSI